MSIGCAAVSYVLNRQWSFRARGGRERHHEAALVSIPEVRLPRPERPPPGSASRHEVRHDHERARQRPEHADEVRPACETVMTARKLRS